MIVVKKTKIGLNKDNSTQNEWFSAHKLQITIILI